MKVTIKGTEKKWTSPDGEVGIWSVSTDQGQLNTHSKLIGEAEVGTQFEVEAYKKPMAKDKYQSTWIKMDKSAGYGSNGPQYQAEGSSQMGSGNSEYKEDKVRGVCLSYAKDVVSSMQRGSGISGGGLTGVKQDIEELFHFFLGLMNDDKKQKELPSETHTSLPLHVVAPLTDSDMAQAVSLIGDERIMELYEETEGNPTTFKFAVKHELKAM